MPSLPVVSRGPLQVRSTSEKAAIFAEAISLHESRRVLRMVQNRLRASTAQSQRAPSDRNAPDHPRPLRPKSVDAL